MAFYNASFCPPISDAETVTLSAKMRQIGAQRDELSVTRLIAGQLVKK